MLAARHRARLAMEEGSDDTRSTKHRNIRRRLFADDDNNQQGSIDNETNRFVEEIKENREKAKEKWNFDFEKEEPLPGKFEWVKPNQDFPESELMEKEKEQSKNSTTENNTEKS